MMRWAVALILMLVTEQADAWPVHGVGVGSSVSNGGMLLNLTSPSYFQGFNPFLNWWKTGSSMTLVSSINGTLTGQAIWDNGTYFSASTGDLKNPVPADVTSINRLFFTPVNWPQYQYEGTSFNNFANQQWDVKWDGCATPTVAVSGTLGSGGSSSFGSNSGTVTLGSSGYSNIGLTFTLTAPCYTNPPINVRVSQHQYAANVAAGQVWNPDWINDVKQFGILRLMDWMQTNFSGITDSSQLADFNYNSLTDAFFMAFSGNASISGTTLTVNSFNTNGANFAVGQTLIGIGTTTPITIASLGSGTGGTGTYNLTCSGACPTVTSIVMMGVPPVGANSAKGPKAGVAPSVACSLASATGSAVEYPIPITATDQYVTDISTALKACMPSGVKVKYSLANEIWNPSFFQFYYSTAQSSNIAANWQGYRAAQIMDIIYNVYGAGQRSRWIGAMGTHTPDASYTAGDISGANAAISGLVLHTLTQLFDQIDVAPYWGVFLPDSSFKAAAITGITVGATPTVTSASHGFSNGQILAMFVSGGTMASALNSNATPGTNVYATVSNVTTNNYQINIDTTGLTYGGSTNYAVDATLSKMADRSVALNISTPATYPTKFSFFAQQMASAILNGSVTDASYGTYTIPNTSGGLLTNSTNSLQLFFRNQALAANQWGLNLAQYEGGPTTTITGVMVNPVAQQLMEFINQSNFDAGVVGDSVNTPANLYATSFAAFRSVNSAYSAQFNDLQAQTQFGPFGALRFTPGDESNSKWQAIVTENALGPYVDPTPPATWSFNYNSSTDKAFGSGSSTTLSCPYTASGNGLGLLALTWQGSQAISSVLLDGSPMTQTSISQPASSWSAAVFSLPVSSGSHTINVTWGSGAPKRACYSMTLTGLQSNTPNGMITGNPNKTTTMNVTKGSFILAVAAASGALTFPANSSLSGTVTSNITQIDDNATQNSGFAYWSPGPSFSSSIFNLTTSSANGLAGAAFR